MKRFPFFAAALVAGAVCAGWGIGKWRKLPSVSIPPSRADGRGPVLYRMYCASCHGPDGHGDSSPATAMRPPPRDFAARPWRFEPTRDSIRRVTLEGSPGTAMPSFGAALDSADVEAVVSYVFELSTAGPVVETVLSEDERLLKAAGFADRRGTTPPPLTLIGTKGETVKLSAFADRLVLLHFWGVRCGHCIKEMPALNALEKQHAGRLKVFHVSADEDDPAIVREVLDRLAPGTAAFTEVSGVGLARYEVQALPTVWLIAPGGKVVGSASGAKDWTADPQTKLLSRWLPMSVSTLPR